MDHTHDSAIIEAAQCSPEDRVHKIITKKLVINKPSPKDVGIETNSSFGSSFGRKIGVKHSS